MWIWRHDLWNYSEENKGKNKEKRVKKSQYDKWNTIKRNNLWINAILEGKDKGERKNALFKEIVAKNF